MSIKQKTISGVKWNAVGKLSSQVLEFIISVILMRLLLPTDYGLIGMSMVFIGFASMFTDFGFGSALVQKKELTEAHKSTIFWFNILIGLFLTLLFYFASDFIAVFFESEQLAGIIKILSLIFLLSSLSIVPNTLLQKAMNFKLINKIKIAVVFITGIVSVSLAFNGFGVWSLVFQHLSTQLVTFLLVFYFTDWRPSFIFSKNALNDLFSYSVYFTGFNFINYWARKSDDLLIGKFIGSAGLGIYSRAYNLMLLPITHIISLFSSVMFPAFSTIQDDKARVKKIYLDIMQVLTLITFPMMIGLIVTAEPFILAIFGQKWKDVIPVLQILSFVGVLQTLGNPTGWIYTSQGNTKLMFNWGAVASGMVIIAIVIGVMFGTVVSVALAYLIVNALLSYPVIAIPGRLINMSAFEVYKKISSAFVFSLIMASVVFLFDQFIVNDLSYIIRLITDVVIGMVTYLLLLRSFKPEGIRKLVIILEEQKLFSGKLSNKLSKLLGV